MQRLILTLVGFLLTAAVISSSATELVWRSTETTMNNSDSGTSYTTYQNQSPALERGVPNTPYFFQVYRVDEIDSLLTARDQAIASQKTQAQEAIGALRQEVRDMVVASLQALPEQLYSAETRASLAAEVANRLTVAMEERIAVARRELRNEILAEVDQRLGVRR